jgi:hypothetical protein
MCTETPKEIPVVEEKSPSFGIRDLTPEDLLESPKKTSVPAGPESESKADRITLRTGMVQLIVSSKPTSKRPKRQYFPPPGKGYASPSDDTPDKPLQYIPPHKLSSTFPAAPFKDDFPPLPPTKAVPPIPSAKGKRRDNAKESTRISRKLCSKTAQVEMDSPSGQGNKSDRVKRNSAIDDLTDAFVKNTSIECAAGGSDKILSQIGKNRRAKRETSRNGGINLQVGAVGLDLPE